MKLEEYREEIEGVIGCKISSYSKIGGLTNLNFCVISEKNEKFLIKLLSTGLEDFIERSKETKAMESLSKCHLYPKIFHMDNKLRVEQFVENSKISKNEFYSSKDIRDETAELLANIQKSLTSQNGEFDKEENKLLKFFENF